MGAGRRVVVAGVAVAAGIAAGALVFKIVGEAQVGSSVGVLLSRFGFRSKPDDTAVIDIIEKAAPGTTDDLKKAVMLTAIAGLLTATAISVAITEASS